MQPVDLDLERIAIQKAALVNVWHKQADGSWKVAVAIWNTDQPAAALGA